MRWALARDWRAGSHSVGDWSERRKNELHICPVDSILLQFRRSREGEVTFSDGF